MVPYGSGISVKSALPVVESEFVKPEDGPRISWMSRMEAEIKDADFRERHVSTLAEYYAGRGNVLKWLTNSAAFIAQIGFPGTKAYVMAILDRRDHYLR